MQDFWSLDATCGFYMHLKIKSCIQNAIIIPQDTSKIGISIFLKNDSNNLLPQSKDLTTAAEHA